MKVIIIEDELHSSRMLEGMVLELRPDWEIIEVFESVESTVDWLRSNDEPDLYFMDIQLTDSVCFSIFEQIPINNHVIFTTAYDEYAIQAFKVNSVDYLLKPIKSSALEAAIEKFEKIIEGTANNSKKLDYEELFDAIKNGSHKYRQRFLVAKSTSFVKVDVSEIAYFYSENRTTFAVTFEGVEHIIQYSLEKLEEQLDPSMFFRTGRSTIVTHDSINKIENYFGGKLAVKLVNPLNQTVYVSRLKATAFKNWIDS